MGQPCSQALFPLVEVYRRERLWTRFVALQVFVNVSRFSPCVIDLSCNKNIRVEESCCEKLSVGLLWATNFGFVSRFHQTHNLSRNKFARALENQPISAPHFFQPQQMFCCGSIKQGEKRETSTKTCNETMLRDKLRVFVSRISQPYLGTSFYW